VTQSRQIINLRLSLISSVCSCSLTLWLNLAVGLGSRRIRRAHDDFAARACRLGAGSTGWGSSVGTLPSPSHAIAAPEAALLQYGYACLQKPTFAPPSGRVGGESRAWSVCRVATPRRVWWPRLRWLFSRSSPYGCLFVALPWSKPGISKSASKRSGPAPPLPRPRR